MPRCRQQSLPHARSRLLRCDVLRQPHPSGFSRFRGPLCVRDYAPVSRQTSGRVWNIAYMNVRTHAVERGDVRHVVIAMGSDSGSGKCVGL